MCRLSHIYELWFHKLASHYEAFWKGRVRPCQFLSAKLSSYSSWFEQRHFILRITKPSCRFRRQQSLVLRYGSEFYNKSACELEKRRDLTGLRCLCSRCCATYITGTASIGMTNSLHTFNQKQRWCFLRVYIVRVFTNLNLWLNGTVSTALLCITHVHNLAH